MAVIKIERIKVMFNLVKLFPKSIWSLFILLSTSCYAIDYTYDELHRLVKVEYESGQTIHYQYDAGGNLLSASETPQQKDWQRVMNWAESLSVDLFPIAGKQFIESPPYLVRHYPLSGIYLGYNSQDNRFYGYNPTLWGTDVIPLGILPEYLPSAIQAGF
jgi:YD repeat-containing protein